MLGRKFVTKRKIFTAANIQAEGTTALPCPPATAPMARVRVGHI